MPTVIDMTTSKRKRQDGEPDPSISQTSKARKLQKDPSQKPGVKPDSKSGHRSKTMEIEEDVSSDEEEIMLLEDQIAKSRKNYNQIPTLRHYYKDLRYSGKTRILAAVSLYRVFCRLMDLGNLSLPAEYPGASPNETLIIKWLRSQFDAYRSDLLGMLNVSTSADEQSSLLTLLMRLLQHQSDTLGEHFDHTHRSMGVIVGTMIQSYRQESIRREFVEKYVQTYDDVRYYTLAYLT